MVCPYTTLPIAQYGVEKREVKAIVARGLHTRTFYLKTRYPGIWIWNTIGCTEIKIALIPFSIQINDIIELWIVRRWLDMLWLQNRLDEIISLCDNFRFDGFWYSTSGWL
jgi:hypothetical protein